MIHTINGIWYSWITGYDKTDFYNGYAGDGKCIIDAIEIKCDKYSINYKSSSTDNGANYYPVVNDSVNDYVGVFGRPLDKVMIWLE